MTRYTRQSLVLMIYTLALVTFTSILLEGCGFRLRGALPLPETLTSVSIEGTSQHSELGRILYSTLQRNDVRILPADSAALKLQIISDEVKRRVLSLDAAGKANEYELTHQLRFSAEDAEGQAVLAEQTVTTVRAYQFDPNQVLAKGDEEKRLRKEMISASVRQMMIRLSAALKRHQTQPAKAPAPAS